MDFDFTVSDCPNSGRGWAEDGDVNQSQHPLDLPGCSIGQCWLCGSVLYESVGDDGVPYGGHP